MVKMKIEDLWNGQNDRNIEINDQQMKGLKGKGTLRDLSFDL